MTLSGFLLEAVDRILPSTAPDPAAARPGILLLVLVLAMPTARRWGRAAVTVIHEAGHAGVGLLVGRRFEGFTVDAGLGGRAITSGRSRGPGRIATVWAGYPMPALIGCLLVQAALGGWAGPILTLALIAELVLFIKSRSARTLCLVLLVIAATTALWWAGSSVVRAGPLTLAPREALTAGAGLALLLGAWDALRDVAASHDPNQDHGSLAGLTRLPGWFWLGTWWLVIAGATAWSAWSLARSAGWA
ncbi:M50 family metallopeptidase [Actinomyces gaoshouyii]|uniref:M50 family metallopeptidase n=1 Tax=Actinomyces gaoshouyii TaxID=1960083 RepID=UPI001F0AA92B|nr:M50 family metallopeptidase [Actinomyces gaoshouyii]